VVCSEGDPGVSQGPGGLDVSHGPDEAVDIGRIHENALVYALAAMRPLS